MTAPLWTGQDWVTAWRDSRLRGGTYAQRIGPDGTIELIPNPMLPGSEPTSLDLLGAGFVLGTPSGAMLLDNDFGLIERLPEIPPHLVSTGTTAFAWNEDLSELKLFTTGSVTSVDPSSFAPTMTTTGTPVGAAGDDSFLIAWRAGSPSQPDQVWFNLVRPNGQVIFSQPVLIHEHPTRLLDLDAVWDGEQYLLTWTVKNQTLGEVWMTQVDESGMASEPAPVWKGIFSGIGLLPVAPGKVLMSWIQDGLRGLLVDQGEPLSGAIIVSDREAILGSDGSGRIAAVSAATSEIRLSQLDTSGALSPGSVSHRTDWLPLRYGTADRARIAVSPGTTLALWRSGDVSSNDTPVILGKLDDRGRRLDEIELVTLHGWGYDLSASRGRALIAWSENVSGTDGSSELSVKVRLSDEQGQWLAPEVVIGEGMEPRVTAHGDGWLIAWTTRSSLLEYRFLGPDGVPEGPVTRVPPPLDSGERIAERQTFPTFASLGHSADLLIWQEGDFKGMCQVLCVVFAAPGIVRTINIRDGTHEPDSLRAYSGGGGLHGTFLGRPGAASMDGLTLMTWIEQQEYDEPESNIEGIFLDHNGEPVGESFIIASGPPALSSPRPPTVTVTGDRFVVVWDHGDWRSSEIRGALVRNAGDRAPEIETFTIIEHGIRSMHGRVLPLGSDSVLLLYSRETPEYPHAGSWQIAARIIQFDAPQRRRTFRRR